MQIGHREIQPMLATSKPLDILVPGRKIVLDNVSWQEYQKILDQLGEHRAARIAYDEGVLTIMAPTNEHEYYKEGLGKLVEALGQAFKIIVRSRGSTTWEREDLRKGVEPDQCFYIQNESLVKGRVRLDLTKDPPPDLVIEVDYSHSSKANFPIYETLGVPELWHYDAKKKIFQVFKLEQGRYVVSDRSPTFPQLPIAKIPQVLDQCETIEEFRAWIQTSTQQKP
jgi:Uma2 family endonuclease